MDKDFYRHPEKHIPIDEIGDCQIQSFYNKYAAQRMVKNMPIFEKAYKLLTERGNFSRENAFGEMHSDRYLWIEQNDKVRVIIEEAQSYRHMFIHDGHSFHIRALQYDQNYPSHRKNELKSISIAGFKKQGFKPHCPDDVNKKRFSAFTYGDNRDEGYILSIRTMWLPTVEEEKLSDPKVVAALKDLAGLIDSEYADQRTLFVIRSMERWTHYLDNPNDLE